MESLEATVQKILQDKKRTASAPEPSEDDLNACLRREAELELNRYDGRVPFSLVAFDAKHSCGSTLKRPAFVDPKGRNA